LTVSQPVLTHLLT